MTIDGRIAARSPAEQLRARPAVLGPPWFTRNGANHGASVDRDTLCWSDGLSLRGDRPAVADSGNDRVLLWRWPP